MSANGFRVSGSVLGFRVSVSGYRSFGFRIYSSLGFGFTMVMMRIQPSAAEYPEIHDCCQPVTPKTQAIKELEGSMTIAMPSKFTNTHMNRD